MLSSKLAGDVTQLKQKAQGKKNLSGTGSRDKEVSPCSSNPKHRHRSQGTSRRESGGQSDTGRPLYPLRLLQFSFHQQTVESANICHNFSLELYPVLLFFFFFFSQKQPAQTAVPTTTGQDWRAVDIQRDPLPDSSVPLRARASPEQGFSAAREQRRWRRGKAPPQRVTPLIQVKQEKPPGTKYTDLTHFYPRALVETGHPWSSTPPPRTVSHECKLGVFRSFRCVVFVATLNRSSESSQPQPCSSLTSARGTPTSIITTKGLTI